MIKIKKLIASVASVAIVLMTSVTSVQAYDDVSSGDWFSPYVEALAVAGIFDASKDTFRAGDNMNRAEFVKTMVQAAGISTDDVEDAGFSDIDSQWFAKYVNAAAAKGIIDGPMSSKGNKFNPGDNIARAAAVKIALGAFGVDADDYQDPETSFNDIGGHWGENYITASYNLSIVDGMGGSSTTFAPNANISRAAVAKVGAFSIIVSDDPSTYVRFEDGTSAFSPFTASDIEQMVGDIVVVDSDVSDDDVSDDDDDTSSPIVVSDGSLEISVSADSPKGAVIPFGVAGVEFVKYDLTANGDDILVTSLTLTRKGLGERDDFSEIVIFNDGGSRISKTKTFNSDDEANITLDSGGLEIEAGETVTVSVRATIGDDNQTGNRAAVTLLSASAVASNASEVVGDFPLNGSTFEIGSQGGGTLTIETNGTVSDVKVGEEEVTVMKVKVTNDDVEDVYFNGITFKEIDSVDENSELMNFKLYQGSDLVATVNSMDSKYLTFILDEPFLVKEGKVEKFSIKADITGGANNDILFNIDKALDVQATGVKYGYGAAITGALVINTPTADNDDDANDVTITAGKVTVVKVNPTIDKVRKDKDNIVFGQFKLVTNAGKNLEFEQAIVTITQTSSSNSSGVLALLENIELYDETMGSTYELTSSAASTSTSITASDTDLGISLSDGESRIFSIRADTVDTSSIDGATFNFSIASIGSTGIKIQETEDDTTVSDITPSAISFTSVDGQTSAATFSVKSLSAAKSVVIGTDNIVALDFEVEADETSDLNITEIQLEDTTYTTSTGAFATDSVAEVKLWKKEGTNETLIRAESNISSFEATFDNIDVNVPKGEKVRFVVTVSVVDDSTNENNQLQLQVKDSGITLEDEDNDTVTGNAGALASDRVITVVGKGSLDMSMDNDVAGPDGVGNVKYNQNMLAGATTDFVAAIKLKATNEPVVLQDVGVAIYSGGSAYTDAYKLIDYVNFYTDDGVTLIAQEPPSSGTQYIEFENFDHEVGETTERIYAKYVLKPLGKDTSAVTVDELNMGFKVLKAKGASSGDQLTTVDVNSVTTTISTTIATTGTLTASSNTGIVVSAKISGASIVNSASDSGASDSLLADSSNISGESKTIGIIKVDVASTVNTDNDNNAMKVVPTKLKVKISKNAGMGFDNSATYGSGASIWIERLGGSSSNKAYINTGASAGLSSSISIESYAATSNTTATGYTTVYAVFDLNSDDDLGSDAEITPGTTAYFVVKANIVEEDGAGNDYILVGLDSFNGTTPPTVGASATETAANFTWSVQEESDSASSLESGRTNLYLGGAAESTNSAYQIDETDS